MSFAFLNMEQTTKNNRLYGTKLTCEHSQEGPSILDDREAQILAASCT